MAESRFDHPVAALIDEEDPETLAAIEEGITQSDNGEGQPLDDMRKEFVQRCSK